MISCSLEKLPEESHAKLRTLFNSAEMKQLYRVLESHQKKHEAEALNSASQGQKYPIKLDAANQSLIVAQSFLTTIETLQQLAKTEDFKTAKLT